VASALPAAARVLVTGGSGFIGTNVVGHFLSNGNTVLNIDSAPPRNETHAGVWCDVDILDHAKLRASVLKFNPTHFIHLAARTDLDGVRIQDYAANTTGVSNVVEVVGECASLQRVIYASSRLVCRIGYQPNNETDYCPPNAYGESKVEGEKIVRAANGRIPWTLVRPTSIWGPWFATPYRTFFDTVRHGRYFNPGRFDPMKSFGFVGNTVHELEALLTAPPEAANGATLYLCDYPPLRLSEWATLIRAAFQVKRIPTIPYSLLWAIAKLGDAAAALGFEPPLTSFRLSNLISTMVHDTDALQKIVGSLPYSLEDGVRSTVEWMRSMEKNHER
jgi:nucleoside-diphosphate-sugar epimerase